MELAGTNFSRMEMSAIKEMANIGLGHATTALSELTGHPFTMDVPSVRTVDLESVPEMIGGTDEVAVGVYMQISGDMDGHMAFIFPWQKAQVLWEMLLGDYPQDASEIDELAASAMLETGNIINSAFMNAISDMSGLRVYASPPLVAVDNCYSIVSSIVAEAEMSEVVALAIETELTSLGEQQTGGYFLYIPAVDSLHKFFNGLRLEEIA